MIIYPSPSRPRGALHEASWSGAGCGACGRAANVAARTREAGGHRPGPLRGSAVDRRLDAGQANGGKPPGSGPAGSGPSPRKHDPPAQNRRGGAPEGVSAASARRRSGRASCGHYHKARLSALRRPSLSSRGGIPQNPGAKRRGNGFVRPSGGDFTVTLRGFCATQPLPPGASP
jgi:hypothetical protein